MFNTLNLSVTQLCYGTSAFIVREHAQSCTAPSWCSISDSLSIRPYCVVVQCAYYRKTSLTWVRQLF